MGLGYTTSVTSSVSRITFSNDTATTSARGPLSSVRYVATGTGNTDYGWYSGGLNPSPSPTVYSTVDRITYASDTATASARGPLSIARYFLASTSNADYAWVAGGRAVPAYSTIDRIIFATDTATATARGPLSASTYRFVGVGNSNYGWFGGGASQGSSNVVRIDYTNDTATASTRGPMSYSARNFAASGNDDYGWYSGGRYNLPGKQSIVSRITYANDTATGSTRGPLSAGVYIHAGVAGIA
jgi:hypothetical protein